ncbi:TIGR00266 family protein [Desulfolutivibrio sp.]|uniref:TIGR00266 family protein n=1 Tax=Desulfolutivibrio sp. TaxID=2773296 RepID=UPI002F96A2C0
MADDIDYRILGDDMQIVEIILDPGEGVRAETGAMLYLEGGIEMATGAGGLMSGLKRMVSGENFFITTFENAGSGTAMAAFGAPYPGKIVPIELADHGGAFLCQKDAYLCSAVGVDITVAFTKRLGAGLFGGEGFILQKLTGDGLAFIHAGGTVIEKVLAAGEVLRVDTGCLAGFEESVDYDIGFVGGFTNALFGGEGMFLASMTGPGRIYLQSLPFSRLADRIHSANYAGREEKKGVAGVGGSLLGGILGGDK